MNVSKFPKYAEKHITREEALKRQIDLAIKQNRHKDPALMDAIKLVQSELSLFDIASLWPESDMAEFLSWGPREYYITPKLENAVRLIWGDDISKFQQLPNGREDRIIIYKYEVERDEWGLDTGWLLFDFAVFNDPDYSEVGVSGTVRTTIDILDATDNDLSIWLYACHGWQFEKKSINELREEYNNDDEEVYLSAKVKMKLTTNRNSSK